MMGRLCTKLSWISCCALVILFALGVCGRVLAQTTAGSGPSPAAARASSGQNSNQKIPRVWTNDDITSLRTPADDYQEKEATTRSAPATEQKIASDKTSPSQPQAGAHPRSLSDDLDTVEKLIAKTEEDVRRKRSILNKASAEAASAGTDLQRSELKSTEEVSKVDLADSEEQLKLLQARLNELKSKHAPEPTQKSQNAP